MRSLVILTHLHATYIILEDKYIQAIDLAIKTPINVETHFKNFKAQIEDNQEEVAPQNPNTTEKILSIAYTLVFKVGFYPLKCKYWRRKSVSDKTWTNFKVHFA